MIKIKLIAILSFIGLIGMVLSGSTRFSASAQSEDILSEIAGYKNWTQINKEPIEVVVDQSAFYG